MFNIYTHEKLQKELHVKSKVDEMEERQKKLRKSTNLF